MNLQKRAWLIISAQESSVKKDNPAKLNVKITDRLGNDNIAEWGYKADYDGNGTISEDEKDRFDSYTGETQVTTRNLTRLGSLEFIVDALNAQGASAEAKTSVNVVENIPPQDLPPSVDLSGVDFKLTETQEKQISLPAPIDPDTPGDILYKQVEILEGAENFENYNVTPAGILTLKPKSITAQKKYGFKLTFENANGQIGTAIIEDKTIENLCRIQGKLESARDPGVLRAGEVRQYNEETMSSENDYIGRQITSDGIIDFIADTPANKVSLQGFIPGDRSFWAKISLDGTKDYLISNGGIEFDSEGNVINYGSIILRPNYYANSISAEEQRAIWEKTDSRTEIAADGRPYGQITPDIENLKVIEILKKNPYSGVEYTTAQQEAIADVYRNNEAVKRVFRGKDLSAIIQIDGEDNAPPTGCINNFTFTGKYVHPTVNAQVILPSIATRTAQTSQYFKDETELSGIIDSLRIEINPSVVPSVVSENLAAILMHENCGHGIFSIWAHVPDAYGFDSIVCNTTRLLTLGGIDYACIDAARNRTFPLRSPSYKTHGLKAGPYD